MLLHALVLTASVGLRASAEPLLSDPYKDVQHLKAVSKKESWAKAQQYLILAPGDQLKTATDGHAQILFDTGTWMEIGSGTRFTFVKETASLREVKLSAGFLRISASPAPPDFKVTTPNATIVSRGGRFTVSARSKNETAVEASAGTVTVRDLAKETLSVREGHAMTVKGSHLAPAVSADRFPLPNLPAGWTIRAPRGFKRTPESLVWKRESESDITLEGQPVVIQSEERILAKVEALEWPVEQDPALKCIDAEMGETPLPSNPAYSMHWERGGRFHRPFFMNECKIQDPAKRNFCQIVRDYGIGYDFDGKHASNVLHLKYAYTSAIAMPGKATSSIRKALEKRFCASPGPGMAAFRAMIDSLESPPDVKFQAKPAARQSAAPAPQGDDWTQRPVQLPTYKP